MALDAFGKVRPRRPSLKGGMVADVTRGAQRIRVYPGKRGPAKTSEEQERRDRWREVAQLTKRWPAFLQAQYAEAVAGTALLPRDLMTMVMYGRFCSIKMDDGRKIYPMTARQDISLSLDILAQTPGSILFRGADWWEAVPIGSPGSALFVQPDGESIAWDALSPGGGLSLLWDEVLAAPAASFDATSLPSVGGDLIISLQARAINAAAAANLHLRFNGDAGANYDYSRWNRFGNATLVAQTICDVATITGATAPAGRAGTVQITVPSWQGTAFHKAGSANNALSQDNTAAGQIAQVTALNWRSTAAINRVQLFPQGTSFATGSHLRIWART